MRYFHFSAASIVTRYVALLAACIGVLSLTGCDTSPDTEDPGSGYSDPWERQFTMGNFALNSGDLRTNEDGASSSYLTDYITYGALPSANFEVFTLHAYLPSTPELVTKIAGIRILVSRTDGTQTGNIFQSGEAVTITTIGGENYSVFRLTGFTTSAAITRDNFANVTFEVQVQYLDGGSVVHQQTLTMEIYKRGSAENPAGT